MRNQRPPFLLAPASSQEFAERVANCLGAPLHPLDSRIFEDGEIKIRSIESVRSQNTFIIHSLSAEPDLSVHDKLCELLFLVRSLKEASAREVTVVIPYLCYSRQDRQVDPQGPVTTRCIAELIEAAGVDRVVTLDVHNLSAYQNAFRCPTVHLSAAEDFADYFTETLDRISTVVVSPDAGGIKRCDEFRKILARRFRCEVSQAYIVKHRRDGVESEGAVVGDLSDRDVLILDDMISTGSTLAHAAKACHQQGAKRIFLAATHGLFTTDAPSTLSELVFEDFVVTNSVSPFRLQGKPLQKRVKVIDVAETVAKAIGKIHQGGAEL